jgi:hypothetical protein
MFKLFSNKTVDEKVIEEPQINNLVIPTQPSYEYSKEQQIQLRERCASVAVDYQWILAQSKVPYANRPANIVIDLTKLHKEMAIERQKANKRSKKKKKLTQKNQASRKFMQKSGSSYTKGKPYAKSHAHRNPPSKYNSKSSFKNRRTA